MQNIPENMGGFCPARHSAGLWPSRALRVHLPFDIRYIRYVVYLVYLVYLACLADTFRLICLET